MICRRCSYPAEDRANRLGAACPECGSTEMPVQTRSARRSRKWAVRLVSAAIAAAPIALLTAPEYASVLHGGSINGWAFVGLTMMSPIIVAVSGLVSWLIVGLTARGMTDGLIGVKVAGQGVLLSLPIQFAMVCGLILCPAHGGC